MSVDRYTDGGGVPLSGLGEGQGGVAYLDVMLFLRVWARTQSHAGFATSNKPSEFALMKVGRRHIEICGGWEEILVGGCYQFAGEIVGLPRGRERPAEEREGQLV